MDERTDERTDERYIRVDGTREDGRTGRTNRVNSLHISIAQSTCIQEQGDTQGR